MRRLMVVAVIGVLLGSSGCTRVHVGVTSYLSHSRSFPEPDTGPTVAIITETLNNEPLLEAEVGRKTAFLLETRGFKVLPVHQAKYVLSIFFAVDDGNTETDIARVHSPGRVATTHIRTSGGGWASGTTYVPGTTSYVPYTRTYFVRHLKVVLSDCQGWASANQQERDESVVWSATCNSAGSSSDLRFAVDYMLVAAFREFGRDSGKRKGMTLYERNREVRALRVAAASSPSVP